MRTNTLMCGYSYHAQQFSLKLTSAIQGYLFRLQTEGTCRAEVNDQTIILEPGDLLLLKPGDVCGLFVEEEEDGQSFVPSGDYHLFCQGGWIKEWWDRSPRGVVSRIDMNEGLLALWRQIITEKRRKPSPETEELIDYLLRSLCMCLERALKETSATFGRPYRAIQMMQYIEEHATRSFKVEDVARHVNLSVSRAVHLFKATFDKTMLEYAQEIRLSAALERMKYTAMTLDQIAESCGFGAYPYFHRIFKKKYGMSPGVYRNAQF